MRVRPAAAWFSRSFLTVACLLGVLLAIAPTAPAWARSKPATKPEGEMRWGLYVTGADAHQPVSLVGAARRVRLNKK